MNPYGTLLLGLPVVNCTGPKMIPAPKWSPNWTRNYHKVNSGMVWCSSMDNQFHCNNYISAKGGKRAMRKNVNIFLSSCFSFGHNLFSSHIIQVVVLLKFSWFLFTVGCVFDRMGCKKNCKILKLRWDIGLFFSNINWEKLTKRCHFIFILLIVVIIAVFVVKPSVHPWSDGRHTISNFTSG